jgi:hypothetical protein
MFQTKCSDGGIYVETEVMFSPEHVPNVHRQGEYRTNLFYQNYKVFYGVKSVEP